MQTGASETQRHDFLNSFHTQALAVLIHEWEPSEAAAPVF
jgi:hypothetical protein